MKSARKVADLRHDFMSEDPSLVSQLSSFTVGENSL